MKEMTYGAICPRKKIRKVKTFFYPKMALHVFCLMVYTNKFKWSFQYGVGNGILKHITKNDNCYIKHNSINDYVLKVWPLEVIKGHTNYIVTTWYGVCDHQNTTNDNCYFDYTWNTRNRPMTIGDQVFSYEMKSKRWTDGNCRFKHMTIHRP